MRLKNDTNNFAASFNITPPYQMLVLHSKMLIYPRELYQRGVQRKRVEMIAADFNEYVANEPKVSFRNGKYYVVDGQHTIEGRILRNGGKDLPILCKVYTGLTMEQEALFFAEQNGHSAPLTAGIKLRAKVVGGDAPSKAFLAATNRVGLAFNYDSLQLSDYRISCVGTALKLYNQINNRIESLERRIQEAEAAEVNEMVRTAKVTPEQLAALLRQSATSTPNPATLSAVGAEFEEEDIENDD